ncbi:MAG: septation protein SpoVG family protein [Candidatus Omnitrophota bacterium]
MGNEGIEIRVERMHRLGGEGPLKGFADISVAGTFLIKGLRIVSGKEGLFVSMPQEQGKNGRWYNTVDLLNKALKEKLAGIVLSAYEE